MSVLKNSYKGTSTLLNALKVRPKKLKKSFGRMIYREGAGSWYSVDATEFRGSNSFLLTNVHLTDAGRQASKPFLLGHKKARTFIQASKINELIDFSRLPFL